MVTRSKHTSPPKFKHYLFRRRSWVAMAPTSFRTAPDSQCPSSTLRNCACLPPECTGKANRARQSIPAIRNSFGPSFRLRTPAGDLLDRIAHHVHLRERNDGIYRPNQSRRKQIPPSER
jgi:hypothetical protein